MPNIDEIWKRIIAQKNKGFQLKQGKKFTYMIGFGNNYLTLSTTNRSIGKKDFEKVLKIVPPKSVSQVQKIVYSGPSYVYAIMTDDRIRGSDW